ncbi:hypothetical protein, partial [Actinomadura napierensis]|uniref:hypothetical protein n=1 Tax=Actinomadura napierensis TaxID=267854 RepID=UPI0031D69CDA
RRGGGYGQPGQRQRGERGQRVNGRELALWRSDRSVYECRFAADDSDKVIIVDGEVYQLHLMPPT